MSIWNLLTGRKTEADIARAVEIGTYEYGQLAGVRPLGIDPARLRRDVDLTQICHLLRLSQAFDPREKRDLLARYLDEPRHVVDDGVRILLGEMAHLRELSRTSPHTLYKQEQRVLAEWDVMVASCAR